MACVLFRLMPREALSGITINGARAIGVSDRVGSIEVGTEANLAIWDIERPADLVYGMSGSAAVQRIFRGVPGKAARAHA